MAQKNKLTLIQKIEERGGSVLVARFSALGDVCMAIPIVYELCRRYPKIHFLMVTKPMSAGVFVTKPDNLTVVGADVKRDYKGVWGVFKLYRRLRRQFRVMAYADLHDVLRSRLLALAVKLRGVKTARLDKGRSEKRALVAHHSGAMHQLESSTDRYADVFRRLGFEVSGSFTTIFPDEPAPVALQLGERTYIKSPGERWIGIAPYAAHRGKIYPEDLMEQVIAKLSAQGVKIFLFGGGEKERNQFALWKERYPGIVSMAEKRYGFETELRAMRMMDRMLTMDSANMHLAALVATPTISLWGATHPYSGFRGWHQDDSSVMQLDMECRPCSTFGNRPCRRGDYACLRGIDPQSIVDRLLSGNLNNTTSE